MMDRRLRQEIRNRAGDRCEYCRLPQDCIDSPHEIDHIIAEKHDGPTVSENLGLACFACNNHKGPNIAGIDANSGEVVRLFHPRSDRWSDHFAWDGPRLIGTTAIGRVTVQVLEINASHRQRLRQALIDEGKFPPPD
jgi:hypothetical protein